MKVVCTTVQSDQVERVVDMLRTLGYTRVELGQGDEGATVQVEVLVTQVEARAAAVALARATSQDPRPVLVTDVSSLAVVGD